MEEVLRERCAAALTPTRRCPGIKAPGATTGGLRRWKVRQVRVPRDAARRSDRFNAIIVTSNRSPDEWHATFADPIRAQAAIDRFTSNAYDLVIDGEFYRSRQKPSLSSPPITGSRSRMRA